MRRIFLFFLCFMVAAAEVTRAEGDHFDVRGGLKTSFNDNVTLLPNNERDDIIQTILLGMDFKTGTSRNSFFAQVDLDQNYYMDNSSFDNTGISARINDTLELSPRWRLNMTDRFSRTEEARSFESQFGRSGGRYETYDNEFMIKSDFDINSHAVFEMRYGHEYTGFSRSDLDDTDMHRLGTRGEYSFDEANRVGAGYEYTHRFFEKGNEITDHIVFADYSHYFTKQLSLTVKAGQDFIDSKEVGRSAQGRYEISLDNEIDDATRGGIKFTKGINDYAYSDDLFESYRISVTVRRELNSRVTAHGRGYYGDGVYQQSQITEQLIGTAAGLEYMLSNKASIGAFYSYSETESNQRSREYQQNVVSILSRVKF